jgi:hypothetical protein
MRDVPKSHVVRLDDETWSQIFTEIGPANRVVDTDGSFVLYSEDLNAIRFTRSDSNMAAKELVHLTEDAGLTDEQVREMSMIELGNKYVEDEIKNGVIFWHFEDGSGNQVCEGMSTECRRKH